MIFLSSGGSPPKNLIGPLLLERDIEEEPCKQSSSFVTSFQESLGPLLLERDIEERRGKQRQVQGEMASGAKVIAIGDVHGCIDELQVTRS